MSAINIFTPPKVHVLLGSDVLERYCPLRYRLTSKAPEHLEDLNTNFLTSVDALDQGYISHVNPKTGRRGDGYGMHLRTVDLKRLQQLKILDYAQYLARRCTDADWPFPTFRVDAITVVPYDTAIIPGEGFTDDMRAEMAPQMTHLMKWLFLSYEGFLADVTGMNALLISPDFDLYNLMTYTTRYGYDHLRGPVHVTTAPEALADGDRPLRGVGDAP